MLTPCPKARPHHRRWSCSASTFQCDDPCPACGYDLRGYLDGRCPECNTDIHLAVKQTDPIRPLRRLTILTLGTLVLQSAISCASTAWLLLVTLPLMTSGGGPYPGNVKTRYIVYAVFALGISIGGAALLIRLWIAPIKLKTERTRAALRGLLWVILLQSLMSLAWAAFSLFSFSTPQSTH